MLQSILILLAALSIILQEGGSAQADLEDGSSCPPLFYGPNCSECIFTSEVICDYENEVSYLHIDYALFHSKHGEQWLGYTIFERSHQNDTERYSQYKLLPTAVKQLNESMCSPIKRTGYMCGSCIPGYAPSPYTYYSIPCTKCSHSQPGWLYYILLELTFPTVMFVVFLAFRIKITSGVTIAFVFYCQISANTFNIPFYYHMLAEKSRPLAHIILTIYGVWNMDFLRLVVPRFCVTENLGTLEVVALGYISAFYPLVLTVVAYSLMKLHHNGCKLAVAMWRPLHRHLVTFRRFLRRDVSLVDTFATFLLLAYSKILFVSLQIVKPVVFYEEITQNSTHRVHHAVPLQSVDPLINYWSAKHMYFAIPASLILFIFCTIPALILCTYPCRCTRKVFSRCRLTRSEDFAKLVNAFQDSYKDGTNCTRDYRPVSVLYVVHRIFIIFSFFLMERHDFISFSPFLYQAIVFITTFAFYSYARPYKSDWHNFIELLLLYLLTLQSVLNYHLYIGCELEATDFKHCSKFLSKLITAQFCLLVIPQVVIMIYLLWLLMKNVLHALAKNIEAHHTFQRNPPLREYTSLSLDK